MIRWRLSICIMRPFALVLFAFAILSSSQTNPAPEPRLGFSKAALVQERKDEAAFASQLSTESISALHLAITKRPHIAGSPASMAVADLLRRRLTEAGLDTEVHQFEVYLSTPKSIAVQLMEPAEESLSVQEPANPLDPDSQHPDLGPAFVAYSASGTVTAPAVYVNYGLAADYDQLALAGVDVKGKIVIARYGRSHRAVKIHGAEQRGAAAIIIYSDPADDGYAKGLAWPEGAWRADFMAQRGTGKYGWFWQGDPLSPGVGARPDADALDPASAPTLPRIPAIVLSSKEASKIVCQLRGPAAPAGFQGALPFTYRLGPGPAVVKLDVQMDAGWRTIRDVIGRLPGRNPERWVVLGTHHDAWTFGGVDPGSSTSAVYETARSLAALHNRGWAPERSIVFAFWDAGEFGLVGSTEYAESFERQLREKAVAYINADLFMRGNFAAGGTPSLRDFLVQVAKDVPAVSGTGSVYDDWRAAEWRAQPADRRRSGPQDFEVELKAPGTGGDFVAFQDYLGLPTLSMQFDFDGSYGTYHSNYDSRYFVEHFSDPGFHVARTLSELFGVAAMRLADAQVLPFRYSHYARKIQEYLDDAANWPRDQDGNETAKLDLGASKAIAVQIAARTEALERRVDADLEEGQGTAETRAALNDQLARLEQTLLDETGGPAKRWYRHVIYGWNIHSLYEGQPLPGLAEAIRLKDPARIAAETARIESALGRMRAGIPEINPQK